MPKKLRCNAKECREPAQRIVGDCTFCNGHFCGKHRLLEDHKCSGLEDVRFICVSLSPSSPLEQHSPQAFSVPLRLSLTSPPFGSFCFLQLLTVDLQCKKQSHARNAAQLEAERTQVIRGV